MTRSLNSDFQTQLRSADPKPVVLLSIATGLTAAGSDYIRICNYDASFKFPATTGSTFTARPFEISEISVDGSESRGMDIILPDVDAAIDTYLLSTDFRLQLVTRYLVERDSLDSSAKAITDVFRIVGRTRRDREVVFHTEPLLAILSRLILPRRSLTREDFPSISDRGVIS